MDETLLNHRHARDMQLNRFRWICS